MPLLSRLHLLAVCEDENELQGTNLAGRKVFIQHTSTSLYCYAIFNFGLFFKNKEIIFCSAAVLCRPSILERCILKVSTSSVAVGTDEMDSKRSA